MKRKRGNKKDKKKGPPSKTTKNEPTLITLIEDEDNSGFDNDNDNGNGDGDGDGDVDGDGDGDVDGDGDGDVDGDGDGDLDGDGDGDDIDNGGDDDNSDNNNDEEENERTMDVDTPDNNNDEEKNECTMDVDTPSSTGTDQPLNLAGAHPDELVDKTPPIKSVGRVKVKLKTSSKLLESQSDTDRSSLQLGLEKQNVASDKMEDTGNSVSEVKMGVSENVSKKPASIKIKSSSSTKVSSGLSGEKSGSGGIVQDESLEQKEPSTPCQESYYSKQELDSALEVIKKIMKMDAAEPFNVPVNPEALGIPDYFDIIDTPMDFGTICSNLEKGDKYMNSKDVFKDVQYIWDNCYKYNSKGDYILELLRRVKKNFMKYWAAAGLYTEYLRGSSGAEGAQGDDGGASSQGHGNKQKGKKRHGRRHKSDCLCAICVLKRRRREREQSERLTSQKLAQELKQEGSLLTESGADGDSSSNMDSSLDPDGDAEVEGKAEVKPDATEQRFGAEKEKREREEDDKEEENEIGSQNKEIGETSERTEFADRSANEPYQLSQPGSTDDVGAAAQNNSQREHMTGQHLDESLAALQKKNKESQARQQRAKMFEKFRPENPMLLSLCQTLFPDNDRSVWRGPHSLIPRQSSRKGSITAAIESLMK